MIALLRVLIIFLSLLCRIQGATLRSLSDDLFCENNDSFNFKYDGRNQDCQWIRNVFEGTRQEVCQQSDVRENCKFSCGMCCDDNPLYTLVNNNGKTKTCEWIGKRENDQRQYWCNFEWEETRQRVTDVCPVSCQSCPALVKVFAFAATETAATLDNVKKNSFPFYYVYGAIGCAAAVVASLVLYRYKRSSRHKGSSRYNEEDDDLTFSQFVMKPSEWFA